ncbi:hypothetical protein L1987_58780 [Smallanthus sonchifolius]|uniref:Uncharacterized protein n=1 Tax=Smallanthus sonchifolius TaxID=185202 RepID=A0ACB9D3B8_9ASTR|nr:hypothetical protein L1987_58780 [Smallanthus sonchifolius]
MDGEQQQIVPYTHQLLPDYVDTLEPGYCFRPTDSELIVYYLKRKIELGEQPKGRLYEVNVYDHHPKQLTGCYASCDDIWYFFTMREAKYTKGTRVNRRTKNFGFWRSVKDATVYDFVTRRVVGKKRSLAFHNENNHKTSWLMHEYTYNGYGTHVNKLTDWVLCKIYKKESTRTVNNNDNQTDQQVQNAMNQGVVIPQQNELHDDQPPPAQRRRVSVNQHHETNHHLGKNINPTPITMQPLATFQDPNQVQSFFGSSTCEHYLNQSKSTSTNGSRFLSGASSSSSVCPTLVTSREIVEQQVHNTYHEDSETLVNMQSCYNGSMDAADWEPHDYEAILSLLDEDDQTDFTSFDELMKTLP